MTYQIPIEQPLTQTQAELTSKIGAMKNLLNLDTFKKKFNVPKKQQMSTYDYLLKVLKSMGIEPEFLFRVFMDRLLDTDELAKIILTALAQLFAAEGKNLDPNSSYQTSSTPTDKQIKELKSINYKYLDTNPVIKPGLVAAINVFKVQLVKNLTILLFGKPQDPATQQLMNPDPLALDELVQESICGSMVFNVSNSSDARNEDLEYNRVDLSEKLKKGIPQFNVTCQGVELKFPENPSYIFGESNPTTIPSQGITPSQSLDVIVNLVANQIQQKNKETNSPVAGKSFRQMMVEKVIANIMTLLRPLFTGFSYVQPGYDGIISVLRQVNGDPTITTSEYVSPPSCSLLQQYGTSPINVNDPANKNVRLVTILCNMLLNLLISILLNYLIKEFKKFILNYFAKKAAEKQKRRMEKIKMKFNMLNAMGSSVSNASSVAQQHDYVFPLLNTYDNDFISSQ